MEFLDRIDESERLRAFLTGNAGGMACLYGRRRIGKSRLLDECVGERQDIVFHIADRSDVALQRARLASDISRLVEGFNRVVYGDWGTLLDRWMNDAPRGSVLVLDEFPYLVEQAKELPSVLQRVLEKIGLTGLKVVICGSSQRMMQGLVLDEGEPLYGRARELMKIEPIGFEWMKRAFPGTTAMSRLEHYGVWGGVPRYWELSEGERNLWETLRRQVFSSLGLLRNEPNHLLMDDLSDSVQASSVLAMIGMGSQRLNEISSRLQTEATALTRPLKRLIDLGLVRKEIPFGCDRKSNKRSLYKVADPFLAFWYRFVLPNYSDERFLSDADDLAALKRDYRGCLGGVWERLVCETVGRRKIPGVSGRLRNASRWWGNGTNGSPMEIDVVAETVDAKTLLVGEAKLTMTAFEAKHALAELRVKASLLPFAGEYEHIECRLFVADGSIPGSLGVEWAENWE